jgi:hypothetical protein
MSRTTHVTFVIGDDEHAIGLAEWRIESKWIRTEHGVDRDHYTMPDHLVEDEFEKCMDHYGFEDRTLLHVAIATKDRRIFVIDRLERREAA